MLNFFFFCAGAKHRRKWKEFCEKSGGGGDVSETGRLALPAPVPSLFNQEEAEKRKQALPTCGKKKETPPPLEEVDLPPCVEIREDSKAWCKICDKKIDSRYEYCA